MGVAIRGDDVRRVLAGANELAKADGDALAAEMPEWVTRIEFIRRDDLPLTYTGITPVLLTARALYAADELDVRELKKGTHPQGYGASSIATAVATFAKEQRIDLRSVSSNPINGQPFTNKDRIVEDMGVNRRYADVWKHMFKIVNAIQALTPEDAIRVLALFMHLSRKTDVEAVQVTVSTRSGKVSLERVSTAVAEFVASNSDGGRVGQAFVAACLDLLYGPDQVELGKVNDPSFSAPGDVRVADPHGVWLYTEAKQKVVATGDATGFLDEVAGAGGERIVYFALWNSTYSGHIRAETIQRHADRNGLAVTILESPQEALDWLLPFAPGSFAAVAEGLLERVHARLVEAGCSKATLEAFIDLIRRHGTVDTH